MISPYKILSTIIILMFLILDSSIAQEDRIVRINADMDGDKVSTGTGFFWKVNGDVLTAYHVVQGAKNIRIYYNNETYDNIEIISYSNKYDLVLLRILDFHQLIPIKKYKDSSNINIKFKEHDIIRTIAHPRGWNPSHHFEGKTTKSTMIWSNTILDKKGHEIFALNIEILPIDLTVFSGMSGAPIILNDEIICVLSGSLDEGRNIAWGIPVNYLKDEMISLNKLPKDFDLPELKLMDKKYWRSVQFENISPPEDSDFQLSALTNTEFDEFNTCISAFFNNYTYNISYGVELGTIIYNYEQYYETLTGIEEYRNTVTDYSLYFNGFIQKKHYNLSLKPYYGISIGFPLNVGARIGIKIIPLINLESRLVYFNAEKKNILFYSFGDSEEKILQDYQFKIFLGVSFNL